MLGRRVVTFCMLRQQELPGCLEGGGVVEPNGRSDAAPAFHCAIELSPVHEGDPRHEMR